MHLPKIIWYGLTLVYDQVTITEQQIFFLKLLRAIVIIIITEGQTSCPTYLQHWYLIWFSLVQVLCRFLYSCEGSSVSCPVVSRRHCLLEIIYCPWTLHSFCPFFHNDSWDLGGRVCDIDTSLGIEIFLFSNYLHIVEFDCSHLAQSTADRTFFDGGWEMYQSTDIIL